MILKKSKNSYNRSSKSIHSNPNKDQKKNSENSNNVLLDFDIVSSSSLNPFIDNASKNTSEISLYYDEEEEEEEESYDLDDTPTTPKSSSENIKNESNSTAKLQDKFKQKQLFSFLLQSPDITPDQAKSYLVEACSSAEAIISHFTECQMIDNHLMIDIEILTIRYLTDFLFEERIQHEKKENQSTIPLSHIEKEACDIIETIIDELSQIVDNDGFDMLINLDPEPQDTLNRNKTTVNSDQLNGANTQQADHFLLTDSSSDMMNDKDSPRNKSDQKSYFNTNQFLISESESNVSIHSNSDELPKDSIHQSDSNSSMSPVHEKSVVFTSLENKKIKFNLTENKEMISLKVSSSALSNSKKNSACDSLNDSIQPKSKTELPKKSINGMQFLFKKAVSYAESAAKLELSQEFQFALVKYQRALLLLQPIAFLIEETDQVRAARDLYGKINERSYAISSHEK